jgi:hypothetical protein
MSRQDAGAPAKELLPAVRQLEACNPVIFEQNMAMPRLFALIAVCLLGFGCGDRTPGPQPEASAPMNEEAPAGLPEADYSSVLAELTQALRRMSAEQREVPNSLDALVAAGYVRNLPQPPPGKVFAIDRKNVRVILK